MKTDWLIARFDTELGVCAVRWSEIGIIGVELPSRLTRELRPLGEGIAGTTATYGEIARTIGRPDGARDVGAALSRNPFPIVVPCHRVIAANGALTGFSAAGGLATKRKMLELEGAPGFGQQLLFG